LFLDRDSEECLEISNASIINNEEDSNLPIAPTITRVIITIKETKTSSTLVEEAIPNTTPPMLLEV